MNEFKALVVDEIEKNIFVRNIKKLKISQLPQGDVLIRVKYSSLNYKDALSARGHKGITRYYPHVPGIDASGVIVESTNDELKPGMEVLVTGYDLGMNTWGGFGQYISVPSAWVVHIPPGLSMKDSMVYGTAGFTAALCLYEFKKNEITPELGKILVTGATGGVGSLAIGLLAKAGYTVIASTGKNNESAFLHDIGANEILTREDVHDNSNKPLLPTKWIGVVETVGGNTLSTAIRSTGQRGVVTCVGNAESDKFETSVYPFLLRGVSLIGIESSEKPSHTRLEIWSKIAKEWKLPNLTKYYREVDLEMLSSEIDLMLGGGQRGRILVNLG
jgi:putative YhdH/YhfP family quinone oxidoreductase